MRSAVTPMRSFTSSTCISSTRSLDPSGSPAKILTTPLPISLERVLVMQVEDVKLLIGVTAERIDTLYVLNPSSGAPEQPFGDRLASAMKDPGAIKDGEHP